MNMKKLWPRGDRIWHCPVRWRSSDALRAMNTRKGGGALCTLYRLGYVINVSMIKIWFSSRRKQFSAMLSCGIVWRCVRAANKFDQCDVPSILATRGLKLKSNMTVTFQVLHFEIRILVIISAILLKNPNVHSTFYKKFFPANVYLCWNYASYTTF
jgi:hypothetical protein